MHCLKQPSRAHYLPRSRLPFKSQYRPVKCIKSRIQSNARVLRHLSGLINRKTYPHLQWDTSALSCSHCVPSQYVTTRSFARVPTCGSDRNSMRLRTDPSGIYKDHLCFHRTKHNFLMFQVLRSSGAFLGKLMRNTLSFLAFY